MDFADGHRVYYDPKRWTDTINTFRGTRSSDNAAVDDNVATVTYAIAVARVY